MDGVDSITARLQSATISSSSKVKAKVSDRAGVAPKFGQTQQEKQKKPSAFKNRLLSLTQRIGIGSIPKMVPAEDIDHETTEGRTIFYDQVVYLLRMKVPCSQYESKA